MANNPQYLQQYSIQSLERDYKYYYFIIRGIWLFKDKLYYFKQYALQKLVSESGKLDVLQNLLLIYDSTNLGLSKVKKQIKGIQEQALVYQEMENNLSRELSESDDLKQCIKDQRKQKARLKEEYQRLKRELLDILTKLSAKDLRSFYVPIKETYTAYMEGRYGEVNKLVTAIVLNFEEDLQIIKEKSGILDIHAEISLDFSYITEDEMFYIDQMIQKDSTMLVISESVKRELASMNKAHIDNNSWLNINGDILDVFCEIMD